MALGTYIAAATNSNPVVLFRALGASSFSLDHTSSVDRSGSPTTIGGYSAIHGLSDGSFVVAVGTQVYKEFSTGQCVTGAMAVLSGGSWSDITVPSGYVFCSVYVSEDGVAYIGGQDTAEPHYGKIWKWTAAGGFVEEVDVLLNATFDAGFILHGTGPSDIWACACYPDNVAYSPSKLYHYDGSTWTSSAIDFRIVRALSASLAYGNGIDDTGGSGGDLYKYDGSWASVDSINPAGSEQARAIAANADIVFVGGYFGSEKVMMSIGENSLVDCTTLSGARILGIDMDPRLGQNVIVVGSEHQGAQQAYMIESTDGGHTWGSRTTMTGYDFAAGIFFATDWIGGSTDLQGVSLTGLELEFSPGQRKPVGTTRRT